MRPRKKVVLLVRDEHAASLWRLRMEIRPYAVLAAATADAALALLWQWQDCDVVVTEPSFESAIPKLRAERPVKVLLIGCTVEQAIATVATDSEVEGPYLPLRVLEKLRNLTAKKRGPKKVNIYSGYLAKKRVRTVAARSSRAAQPERLAA